jgi:hypothetical protein
MEMIDLESEGPLAVADLRTQVSNLATASVLGLHASEPWRSPNWLMSLGIPGYEHSLSAHHFVSQHLYVQVA